MFSKYLVLSALAAIVALQALGNATAAEASSLGKIKACSIADSIEDQLDDLDDFIADGVLGAGVSLGDACKEIKDLTRSLEDQSSNLLTIEALLFGPNDKRLAEAYDADVSLIQLNSRLMRFCGDYKNEKDPKKILSDILGKTSTGSYLDAYSIRAVAKAFRSKVKPLVCKSAPSNVSTAGTAGDGSASQVTGRPSKKTGECLVSTPAPTSPAADDAGSAALDGHPF